MNESKKLTTSDKIGIAGVTMATIGLGYSIYRNLQSNNAETTTQIRPVLVPTSASTSESKVQAPLKYGYANGLANLYSYVQESLSFTMLPEQRLAVIPDKTFIGMFTGNQKGDFYEFQSRLNNVPHTFWVTKKEIMFSADFIPNRTKKPLVIREIIKNSKR